MAINQTDFKDEVMSNIHQGILDVQHASDGVNTVEDDRSGTEGNSAAAQPEELPTKKPEVEPEKILKENPGIQPETEGEEDDEGGEPPVTQPGIVMGVK